jgi:hypothetical protein
MDTGNRAQDLQRRSTCPPQIHALAHDPDFRDPMFGRRIVAFEDTEVKPRPGNGIRFLEKPIRIPWRIQIPGIDHLAFERLQRSKVLLNYLTVTDVGDFLRDIIPRAAVNETFHGSTKSGKNCEWSAEAGRGVV